MRSTSATTGAYSNYNWELFFHTPVLIAVHLSKNQRFEEAQRWFHYVFDPTTNDLDLRPPAILEVPPLPRGDDPRVIDRQTPHRVGRSTDQQIRTPDGAAIQAWRDKPFQPHVVARGAALAYQIQRGDEVPRQPGRLGRPPVPQDTHRDNQRGDADLRPGGEHPRRQSPNGSSARSRKATAQELCAVQARRASTRSATRSCDLEDQFPFNPARSATTPATSGRAEDPRFSASAARSISAFRRTTSCWPTGTRSPTGLFKMRHCMNIEGVVRSSRCSTRRSIPACW